LPAIGVAILSGGRMDKAFINGPLHPSSIAVITVEPADKISFVYNCM